MQEINELKHSFVDNLLPSKAIKLIRVKQKTPLDIIVNTKKSFDIRKDKSASVEREVEEKGVLLYGA